jgi:TPR repeat protein
MLIFKGWKIKRITKRLKAMIAYRASNQPSDEVLKKEILYYFELAAIYKHLKGNKKFPYTDLMVVECYRAAADLNDAAANYQLAQLFLDEAKYRRGLNNDGIFTSQANLKRSDQLFEEAHAHLIAAEKLGHVGAKRLRGLCIINGWGVTSDKNTGFELVVASIDQEGSWEKVPQIFASMGLNKPEFFAAIMQRRKDSSTSL